MKTISQVQKYVNSIKHIFLIDQFDLEVRDGKSDGEKDAATMVVRYDYLDAVMTICPAFYELRESDQKKTIVHELAHFITLLQYGIVDDLMTGKVVTEKHATEVMERENSWIERILCENLKKELKL